MESNHLPIGYRPIARPESLAGMEPVLGVEPGSAAYRAAALPLSYTGWSECGESNSVGRTGNPALNQ
jgi:hypothetical protein